MFYVLRRGKKKERENNCINYQWKQSLPWQSSLSAQLLKDQYILTLIRLVCLCREFQQEEGEERLCFPTGRKSPAAESALGGAQALYPHRSDEKVTPRHYLVTLASIFRSNKTATASCWAGCPSYILTRLVFSWEMAGATWTSACVSHCSGRAKCDQLRITQTSVTTAKGQSFTPCFQRRETGSWKCHLQVSCPTAEKNWSHFLLKLRNCRGLCFPLKSLPALQRQCLCSVF